MIVSFILCSFRSVFDNFVLSHKQNPLFCRLCKLKSGILYRFILFYDYFEHFAMFIYFLKPSIQAKRECRKIIKLDDRVTPSLNLKGKTEVISPVLWLTSVFWRTLIKIFVFSIFKQVFSQEINVFLFGHSVFSREVY